MVEECVTVVVIFVPRKCIEYEEGKFLCVNDSLRGCEHDEGSEWREGWRWKPNGDGGDFGGTVVLRMGEIKVECEAHDLWLWMGDESVNNGEAKKIMVMCVYVDL